ncbi:GGDEF domain-containing protein [Catellatospora sp. NPDC049609]|uniref:GGDEF domain-containing protein n=1 Tax=Catellatospora sp. NPDC049609 TaxID=3155505 RepID=UPI00343E167D
MSTKTSTNALTLPGVLSAGLALVCSLGWAGSALRQHRESQTHSRQLDAARHAAATDPLTGLPNRAALTAHLAGLAHTGGWCLAMADLDRFKSVNDTLGHDAGDQVLTTTARRLAAALPGATVARLGGDEFAIILPTAVDRALPGLQQAVAAVARPQQVRGLELRIGCSASLAEQAAGVSADELMRRADTALYQAKQSRGRAVAWTPDLTPPLPPAVERRQTRPRRSQPYATATA